MRILWLAIARGIYKVECAKEGAEVWSTVRLFLSLLFGDAVLNYSAVSTDEQSSINA